MKTINVKGLDFAVDDYDFDWLSRYNWFVNNQGYAMTNLVVGGIDRKPVPMHRLVLDYFGEGHVHHKNNRKWDNRKENLQVMGVGEHNSTRRPLANKQSKYKGVCWFERTKKWVAYIGKDGKTYNLGYYETEEQAAVAYDNAAKEKHGESAYLNFPTKVTFQ